MIQWNDVSLAGAEMEADDEPLLFQASWGRAEEEEEDEVMHAAGQSCSAGKVGVCGVWRAAGWIYTQPWASGLVLGVAILLPCALFAYMLLYCPPLDIDLSYSAFEVHSHFSAERFDALTIAVKTQLGSWDRRRRDVDYSQSEALQELLLGKLGRTGWLNKTHTQINSTSQSGKDLRKRAAAYQDAKTKPDLSQRELRLQVRNSSFSLNRRRRFASNYYMQSQALWRIELVFVAQGKGNHNIFTPERLQTIHQVEHLLMQHPQFHQFCWKPLEITKDLPLGPSYCSPPSSVLSYLYPSERGGKIYYDGMGPDLADIQGKHS